MGNMLETVPGFQYSVNIAFDINNDEKISSFIPTASSLTLLENILRNAELNGTDRARILIGPYGKGKSHIVLMILAMLMKKDKKLFSNLREKIKERPKLIQAIENYYDGNTKLLPVIISGANTSLPQAFLLALHRTLSENGLLDIMPNTNYKAAASTIEKWKKEYPDTYDKFCDELSMPVDDYIDSLNEYNIESYELFERIYPQLTSGSVFNPFVGFDVIELYENVLTAIKEQTDYTGLFVVYDEFSKFLESNIKTASTSDTNMLQSFAEKCNRSGKDQLHLMLISHKEIENYIDQLPKNKIDGWRGVSERFTHVILNNNFKQMYEIISSVIKRDKKKYSNFKKKHSSEFESLYTIYRSHNLFSDLDDKEYNDMLYGCYPLHPMSMFILPRLSEKVAQNERTLFTFMSADGENTLSSYLQIIDQKEFNLVTPDILYDYFEPLFKKEVYDATIHENYYLTSVILDKISDDSLGCKLVKTISLIYILDQFDKLTPTKSELYQAYSFEYSKDEIDNKINDLIEKELVIYLRKSNNYLRLKQSSGVNIRKEIADTIEKQRDSIRVKDSLNGSNFDNYLYPSRYNDDNEMIRYFAFDFVNDDELFEKIDWNLKTNSLDGDGVVYGIIPSGKFEIKEIEKKVKSLSEGLSDALFVILKEIDNKEAVVREYEAVNSLMKETSDDRILFEEYEVVYDDLREIILDYISDYIRPERAKSRYYYDGKLIKLARKAALTEELSKICYSLFPNTPIVNNEAINKINITTVAKNSRDKIVAGLLRGELEPNLGLTGTGQEVSIMRSTLTNKGILVTDDTGTRIVIDNEDPNMNNMLHIIDDFIVDAKKSGGLSLSELYYRLTDSSYGIGVRLGIIPIYIAAVFHNHKKEIIINDKQGQVPITVDVLNQINAQPDLFSIEILDWDSDKEEYITELGELFVDYVSEYEKNSNAYEYVSSAIRRWYMNLPKYSRDYRKTVNGKDVDEKYSNFLKSLSRGDSGQKLLFDDIPKAFKTSDYKKCLKGIKGFKKFYDDAIGGLIGKLIVTTKEIFIKNVNLIEQMSLASIIKDWCESLDGKAFEQLFSDGTDRCLKLFSSVSNDDTETVINLARIATDLRLEDWTENTIEKFLETVGQYKSTAEMFSSDNTADITSTDANSYQVTFVSEDGSTVTKRFERTEKSSRGKLLYNQILSNLDSMGQSITEQEKRQILMDILNKFC